MFSFALSLTVAAVFQYVRARLDQPLRVEIVVMALALLLASGILFYVGAALIYPEVRTAMGKSPDGTLPLPFVGPIPLRPLLAFGAGLLHPGVLLLGMMGVPAGTFAPLGVIGLFLVAVALFL